MEDTLSIEKGSEDGQKYCGPRIYVINDPVPCWASIERNILTIRSDLVSDFEEVADVTITVILANSVTDDFELADLRTFHSCA